MSKLQVQNNALVRGTSCWVRAGANANTAKKIGFCDSFRGSKNLQLQRANVCGSIYPVSIDPSGVQTSISISGFIPTKKVIQQSDIDLNGKGEVNITLFNPDETSFIENESITKIPYIDFYDENAKTIIVGFRDAVASTFNITGNGGGYVKGDLQLEAITMTGGVDYSGDMKTQLGLS